MQHWWRGLTVENVVAPLIVTGLVAWAGWAIRGLQKTKAESGASADKRDEQAWKETAEIRRELRAEVAELKQSVLRLETENDRLRDELFTARAEVRKQQERWAE